MFADAFVFNLCLFLFVLCFQVLLWSYWNRWYATFTFQVLSWVCDVFTCFLFLELPGVLFLLCFVVFAKSGLLDKCWLSIILVILEKAREGLAEFVSMMKKALAALTGVAWLGYPMIRSPSYLLGLLDDSSKLWYSSLNHFEALYLAFIVPLFFGVLLY